MAVTIENLLEVERTSVILRSAVQRKTIADAGTYSYQNPVSGDDKVASVTPAEKTAVTNEYKAALAALKAAVQALSE